MDEKLPEEERLFKNNEEFFECLNLAVGRMHEPLMSQPPDDRDKEALKSLLAMYMTGVFDADRMMGPNADPDLKSKVGVIRLTLLAGYNLGRMRGNFPKE